MTSTSLIGRLTGSLLAILVIGLLFTVPIADAKKPPTQVDTSCTAGGVVLSLVALRADGVTSVGTGTVALGENIYYRATLSNSGGSHCTYSGGDLDIVTPDGVFYDVDGGNIPTVTPTSPFVSALAPYTVRASDVSYYSELGNQVVYLGGASHTQGKDTAVDAHTPLYVSFQKLNSPMFTEVHDSAHVNVTGGAVAQGTPIHAKFVGPAIPTAAAPTGNIYFYLYEGSSCSGNSVQLASGLPWEAGILTNGQDETYALTPGAGTYSYSVDYVGDLLYNSDTTSCVSFSVL